MADAGATRDILEFVLTLSQNPDKAQAYKANPTELMTAEGLSPELQQEILAAQQAELSKRVAPLDDDGGDVANNSGNSGGGGGTTVILAVVVVVVA